MREHNRRDSFWQGLPQFAKEEWFEKGKFTVNDFARLINIAKESVHIVAGGLDSNLYGSQTVDSALESALQRNVNIVLAQSTPTDQLRRILPNMTHLHDIYPNFNLFELKTEPQQRYTVIDQSHVLFEQPRQNTNEPHTVLIRYFDEGLGKNWEARLKSYLNKKGIFVISIP